MINIFGHDLYLEMFLNNTKYWYRCKKCNIRYFSGEFIKSFYNNDSLHIKNITCDEYIIKQIIK